MGISRRGIGVLYAGRKSNAVKIPKKLPLFLVSGAKDPVGEFGKGVIRAYDMYKAAGINDVSIKLYENDRQTRKTSGGHFDFGLNT